MKRILIFLIVFVLSSSFVFGAQFYGGKGFLHTTTALGLPPGALDLSLFARGYLSRVSGTTVSNGTGAFAASFGFSRKFELSFVQILYQDLNYTLNKGPLERSVTPGNAYFRFKFCNYTLGSNMFWGIAPALRYRVARYQDVQFEPYSSQAVEAELTLLGSYYQKPLYPDESISAHVNLGYINHNDAEKITDAAQAINYLVSFMIPRKGFDYGMEVYGSAFIQEPTENKLSREDYLYVTPMVRYKFLKGLHFYMGLDLLMQGKDDTSFDDTLVVGADVTMLSDYSNYASWRISGKIQFSPSTTFYAVPTFDKVDKPGGAGRTKGSARSASGKDRDLLSRQELFRWAIEEKFGGTEAVDLDLEKIRMERKRAEDELKRLRDELKEKEKKASEK